MGISFGGGFSSRWNLLRMRPSAVEVNARSMFARVSSLEPRFPITSSEVARQRVMDVSGRQRGVTGGNRDLMQVGNHVSYGI
jgi:hypothetical protein